jgi:hypothetical protein
MVAEGRQLVPAELPSLSQKQFLAGLITQHPNSDETHPRRIVFELVGLARIK